MLMLISIIEISTSFQILSWSRPASTNMLPVVRANPPSSPSEEQNIAQDTEDAPAGIDLEKQTSTMGEVLVMKENTDRHRDFQPTLPPGFRDWKRSKRILRPSDIEVFKDLEPSFFAEVASIVCQAEAVPRKELFESWEVANHIDANFPQATRIADLAAGHGLLGWFLLLLAKRNNRPRSVVSVDVRMPPSACAIRQVITKSWPDLAERMHYVVGNLKHVDADQNVLLTSVHACGPLTDVVIERAVACGASVVVMPCCHSLRQSLPPAPGLTAVKLANRAKELGVAQAVDAERINALRSFGYTVKQEYCDDKVTNRNRLIVARLSSTFNSTASQRLTTPIFVEEAHDSKHSRIPVADVAVIASLAKANRTVVDDIATRRGLIMKYDKAAGYTPPINTMLENDAFRLIGDEMVREGLVTDASGTFVRQIASLLKGRAIHVYQVILDIKDIFAYPLEETLDSERGQIVSNCNTTKIVGAIVKAHENGSLGGVGTNDEMLKSLVESLEDERGAKKGKILYKLFRIFLTGRSSGPPFGLTLDILNLIDDTVVVECVTLDTRIEKLIALSESSPDNFPPTRKSNPI